MVRIAVIKLIATVYEEQHAFIGDCSWHSRKKVFNSYIQRRTKNYIRLEVNWGGLIRSLSSQSGTPELSGVLTLSHCLLSLEFAAALRGGPNLVPVHYVIKLPVEAKSDQYWIYTKHPPKVYISGYSGMWIMKNICR